MKSKVLSNLFLIMLFLVLFLSFYFLFFYIPTLRKIEEIAKYEMILSEHKLELSKIRISIMGILSLSAESSDLQEQKDFYFDNINTALDKIDLTTINPGLQDINELGDLSKITSQEILGIYEKLQDVDKIYGKIFQYHPKQDLELDLKNHDFNSIISKMDGMISFFNLVRNENPENEKIKLRIEASIEILHKIKSRAELNLDDDEIRSFISDYEMELSLLKSEIVLLYKNIIKSNEAVTALKDLSNLIIIEDNYLSELGKQKRNIIRSLIR